MTFSALKPGETATTNYLRIKQRLSFMQRLKYTELSNNRETERGRGSERMFKSNRMDNTKGPKLCPQGNQRNEDGWWRDKEIPHNYPSSMFNPQTEAWYASILFYFYLLYNHRQSFENK